MNNKLADWIHDDITWCSETECPNKECMRNLVNKRQKTGVYAMSKLRGTELCPLTNPETQDKTE